MVFTLHSTTSQYSNRMQPQLIAHGSGNYFVHFTDIDGRDRQISTSTSDSRLAESCVEAIVRDANLECETRKTPLIKDFIWTYETSRLPSGRQPSDSTKRRNALRMEAVLKDCGINPETADIRSFAKKAANGMPICEDYLVRKGRAGHNNMRQARSLLSKQWIKFYKQVGIDTSCFSNWIAMSVESVQVKQFDASRSEESLIELRCEALKETDHQLYLAYALAYGIGLRSSEILRCKYSDFIEDYDGNKLIRISKPKSIRGATDEDFQMRVCDPWWWKEIVSNKTSHDDLIITAQEDRITREFPKFLKEECGITDKRPVHRLRKYAGHRIMRLNGNNAFIAQRALGHSSVEMTAKVYVGMPSVVASR